MADAVNPAGIKAQLVALLSAALPSVDVFYGLDEGGEAAKNVWISVMGGAADFEGIRLGPQLRRYERSWSFDVRVGSGPGHTNPEEANAVAYSLADAVVEAIAFDPEVGLGASGVYNSELNTISIAEGWPEDGHQVVLDVGITVKVRS